MVVTAETVPLVGGALCLDFVNTVDARFPRPGERPPDYIADYASLVAWSRRAGALQPEQAAELLKRAEREARADAHRLRDAVDAVLAAAAAGHTPPKDAAARLRTCAAEAIAHGELAGTPLGWRWTAPDPRMMLWPIALSALELATSEEELARLKQCPGQEGRCGWMFLDRTKNGGRRWCSMRLCGNPVKARRQNARRRSR